MRESNYARFLRADFGCAFHEYLGIEMPKIEANIFLTRFRMRSPRGCGEWHDTRRDAKVSYKADMARRKGRLPNAHSSGSDGSGRIISVPRGQKSRTTPMTGGLLAVPSMGLLEI